MEDCSFMDSVQFTYNGEHGEIKVYASVKGVSVALTEAKVLTAEDCRALIFLLDQANDVHKAAVLRAKEDEADAAGGTP